MLCSYITVHTFEQELDEEEVAELVEHELEIQEYKRTHKWKHYMLSFAAKVII